MKRLWAPWRMEYIEVANKNTGCIFCERKQYVLKEGKYVFAMLNLFPYNPGHIMVAPKRHIKEPEELNREEVKELFEFINLSVKALKEEANPDGFNIGLNIGKVAGAGFEGHLHLHIVPRWNGDTNFMPVIGDVRVVPEGIDKTFEKLKKYF
ncbi:MAG TPA: HIT domain-containing protein [Candidatus Hydrothermia bacterium]|nr:HIT domain-containing protein [Candidatus Hydrothermae bacterium]MDD3649689.1 HIT domain-containing protein [Candidatus Hydrothermia bacterium]MDD5573220.1 HIT domain-containing protein [Candidatus Hydrothermia bacterium]HOK23617.1 HIT domain-containing protein [Candidatus Hydrothermia bacterium]HOL24333.1 HIT domain-containing protein [Candidatus Hydrothermia bacterium]